MQQQSIVGMQHYINCICHLCTIPETSACTDQDDRPLVTASMEEEYNLALMDMLNQAPEVTPAGNHVRDEQRKLKAHKRQELKDC